MLLQGDEAEIACAAMAGGDGAAPDDGRAEPARRRGGPDVRGHARRARAGAAGGDRRDARCAARRWRMVGRRLRGARRRGGGAGDGGRAQYVPARRARRAADLHAAPAGGGSLARHRRRHRAVLGRRHRRCSRGCATASPNTSRHRTSRTTRSVDAARARPAAPSFMSFTSFMHPDRGHHAYHFAFSLSVPLLARVAAQSALVGLHDRARLPPVGSAGSRRAAARAGCVRPRA